MHLEHPAREDCAGDDCVPEVTVYDGDLIHADDHGSAVIPHERPMIYCPVGPS